MLTHYLTHQWRDGGLMHSTALQFTRYSKKKQNGNVLLKNHRKIKHNTSSSFNFPLWWSKLRGRSKGRAKLFSKTEGRTTPCHTNTFAFFLLKSAQRVLWLCVHVKNRCDQTARTQMMLILTHPNTLVLLSSPSFEFSLDKKNTGMKQWHCLHCFKLEQLCSYWHKMQWLQSGIVAIATVLVDPINVGGCEQGS